MLLFGVGGERSDEVLKNSSSPSLGLFIWQGSDGSGDIMFMFCRFGWVVPDLAHLAAVGRLLLLVCDVRSSASSAAASAGVGIPTSRSAPVGFDPAASRFPRKTRDHAAHDARHLIHVHKFGRQFLLSASAVPGKRNSHIDLARASRGQPQRKLLPREK